MENIKLAEAFFKIFFNLEKEAHKSREDWKIIKKMLTKRKIYKKNKR